MGSILFGPRRSAHCCQGQQYGYRQNKKRLADEMKEENNKLTVQDWKYQNGKFMTFELLSDGLIECHNCKDVIDHIWRHIAGVTSRTCRMDFIPFRDQWRIFMEKQKKSENQE